MTPPLAGLRVVCAAVYVPAPLAARRLHALGAAVAKIEPPAGDPLAALSPSWYAELNAGYDVARLDLKRDADRARFDDLLADADVLLTATRPDSLARLGLAWDALHARHPRCCHVAIVGHASPHAARPGHDLTYQAAAGVVAPPRMPATLLADVAGAERAASAAVALLLARERRGAAGRAEVSLADAATPFAEPLRHGVTAPAGPLGGASPTYALYPARDGWVAVGALEPHFRDRLCAALDVDPTCGPDALAARLGERLAQRSAAEWEEWALARDLPLAAVRGAPA
jgi:crotonobetainyl-CoA:carnitine CoA-transferase CaiB-like acyl-CoA transferase